ncbi:hypothetical protein [Lentilactobacillus sp. Marseille-Q4993]|uniref:hypothetical protein n=1 Tax=Lentilactobacillus sp. Marseille-Q4993 TaxID=3039492 RepID=UPI0024BCF47B|nr:hypothetical protein [Lentilactobacillus sp. Marseille-Q4993]
MKLFKTIIATFAAIVTAATASTVAVQAATTPDIPAPSKTALAITKKAKKYISLLPNGQFTLSPKGDVSLSKDDLITAIKLIDKQNAVLKQSQKKVTTGKWISKSHPKKKFVSFATYRTPTKIKQDKSKLKYNRNFKIVTPFYTTTVKETRFNDKKLAHFMNVSKKANNQMILSGWHFLVPAKTLATYSTADKKIAKKTIDSANQSVNGVRELAKKGDVKIWRLPAKNQIKYKFTDKYYKNILSKKELAKLDNHNNVLTIG